MLILKVRNGQKHEEEEREVKKFVVERPQGRMHEDRIVKQIK